MSDPLPLPLRWRLWVVVRSARVWRAVGAVLIVASTLTSAYLAGPGACKSRTAGREDVRRAIVAGVDEVADYAALDPPNRQVVVGRVEDRVYHELPPPDC